MGAPYNHRPCATSIAPTMSVDGRRAGRPRGAATPRRPRLHASLRAWRQRPASHPLRRRGARRLRPPHRRAPSEPPSPTRPCGRRGGGAPLPRGAGGCRRGGAGGHRGGRHKAAPTCVQVQRRRGALAGGGEDDRRWGAGSGVPQPRPGVTPLGGGGRRPRRHRRGRPDGDPLRATVASPAGRSPPRRSRATTDAAAAGR